MYEIIASMIIGISIAGIPLILILFLKEKKFNPENWKKNSQLQISLKQIEAYGELLAFLDAAQARKKNLRSGMLQVKKTDTHLFLLPGHEIQFNKIFRENMSFFSPEVIKSHIKLLENDKDFDLVEKIWPKNQTSWYQGYDISEMHQLVKSKFYEIRQKCETVTGYSFS